MDPILAGLIGNLIAALLGALALIQNHRLSVKQQREQRRHEVQEQEWQRQEREHQLVVNQPRLEPIGASLHINNDRLPEVLDANAKDQSITLINLGKSMPSNVHAVLFPCASDLPEDALTEQRTSELMGTYWEGTLEGSLKPSEQLPLVLYVRRFPLDGRQQLISGRTLFAPPNVDGGLHNYFGRLTVTFRDDFGRILAADFDGESVVRNSQQTQVWRPGARLREVDQHLRDLNDQAARDRRPPVYRGRV